MPTDQEGVLLVEGQIALSMPRGELVTYVEGACTCVHVCACAKIALRDRQCH